MGGYFIGLIAVFLLCLFLAIFIASFITLAKYLSSLWNLNIMGYAILFSVFYGFAEYTRGNLLGGFPWNTLGYIWSDSYFFLKPVALFGIYGLGLISIIAILSVSLFFKNKLFAFYAILPMVILSSYFLLKDESIYSEKENISIRLVQPNIKQEENGKKT